MKKFKTFISAIVIAMTAATLTSCDGDQMIAMTLEGTWGGDMYVSSTYNGHTYNASYTEIEFTSDPFRFTKGYGYWVDHYSSAPWDKYISQIRWEVQNRIITIYFIEDHGQIDIYNYRLNDNYFEGVIYSDDDREALNFRLHKIDDDTWGDYHGDWGYVWNSYYAKKNVWEDEEEAIGATTEATTVQEMPKRHFGVRK